MVGSTCEDSERHDPHGLGRRRAARRWRSLQRLPLFRLHRQCLGTVNLCLGKAVPHHAGVIIRQLRRSRMNAFRFTVAVLLVAGCSDQPSADRVPKQPSEPSNDTVQPDNTAEPKRFNWDGGDGTITDLQFSPDDAHLAAIPGRVKIHVNKGLRRGCLSRTRPIRPTLDPSDLRAGYPRIYRAFHRFSHTP
jgi:hypothetical protein